MKLDFSEFHPLDHRIGSRDCRNVPNFSTAPKGWRNIPRHAHLWWDYRGSLELRRMTLCRVRRHRVRTWTIHNPDSEDTTEERCIACGQRA